MAQSQLPPFAQATAGALGSIASNTLVYPLDLLSTRAQTQSSRKAKAATSASASIPQAFRHIIQTSGVGGLYQGLGSDTLSNTLSNFLFFYFRSFFIEQVLARKRTSGARKPVLSPAEDLAVGALAGIASRLFTTPLSNVTVRKQTAASACTAHKKSSGDDDSESDEETYGDTSSIADTLREIVREKGVAGLWSGFSTAALLSISPALTFYASNAASKLIVRKDTKPTPTQTFLTSAIGNTIATTIVFPLILSKTRLQWRSPTGRRMYRNLHDVVSKTIRKAGFKGLYQGLETQLIKGLFSFSTTMVVKQRIESLFVLLYLAARRRSSP